MVTCIMSLKLPFTFYLCKYLEELDTLIETLLQCYQGECRTMYNNLCLETTWSMKLEDMVRHRGMNNALSTEVVYM